MELVFTTCSRAWWVNLQIILSADANGTQIQGALEYNKDMSKESLTGNKVDLKAA